MRQCSVTRPSSMAALGMDQPVRVGCSLPTQLRGRLTSSFFRGARPIPQVTTASAFGRFAYFPLLITRVGIPTLAL